jgi:hypothetical protein
MRFEFRTLRPSIERLVDKRIHRRRRHISENICTGTPKRLDDKGRENTLSVTLLSKSFFVRGTQHNYAFTDRRYIRPQYPRRITGRSRLAAIENDN